MEEHTLEIVKKEGEKDIFELTQYVIEGTGIDYTLRLFWEVPKALMPDGKFFIKGIRKRIFRLFVYSNVKSMNLISDAQADMVIKFILSLYDRVRKEIPRSCKA